MSIESNRPLPVAFEFRAGQQVEHQGRHRTIVSQLALSLFLVEDVETQERVQAHVDSIRIWRGNPTQVTPKVPDLATIPQEKIDLGIKRQAAIKGLLAMKYRTRGDVKIVGEELGLSVSQLYALMKRYESEGGWTCLTPHLLIRKPRAKRLPKLAEEIIQEAIDALYLDRHQAAAQEIVSEAQRRCKSAGLKPPAPNSIRARIRARDAKAVVEARQGKKAARDRFGPVLGPYDEPRWPLQRIAIDHTVADLFVVDEESRLPIARPILTLMIDEFSRAVVGMHLSLYPPSTLSVALALTHGILPKSAFLKKHEIAAPWEICGLPNALFTDNAAEFDSRGLAAGCARYDIEGQFRPLGRPHFGGRIERLIGTVMGRLKLMPGATMRSVAERGDEYDPEKAAAYTLAEAETRIATEILEVYHRTVHGGTGVAPLKLYEFGVLGDDKTPGRGLPRMPTDPQRLLIDFLPLERRTIQDYGIQLDFLRYHSPVLRAFHRQEHKKEQFVVRYDPRDLSRVFLFNPEDGEYLEIPRANAHFPAVALWEVKAAIKHLKEAGADPDDEAAIHRAIERMRRMDEDAIEKSKRARRNVELRRLDRLSRLPPAKREPPPAQVASDTPGADPNTPAAAPARRIRPITDVEAW